MNTVSKLYGNKDGDARAKQELLGVGILGLARSRQIPLDFEDLPLEDLLDKLRPLANGTQNRESIREIQSLEKEATYLLSCANQSYRK